MYNHAKKDYLFFPLLIGYVERYLKNENSEGAIRNHVLQVIYDLSVENNFKIILVHKKSLDEAKWNNLEELMLILKNIDKKWKDIGKLEPEMDEIAWFIV